MKLLQRTFLLILFCLVNSQTFAQFIYPFEHNTDSTLHHEIRLQGGNYLHATGLPNYFTNHFYNGSSFDTVELNRFDERLKRENRLGVELDYEVEYRYSGPSIKKYPDLGFMFRAGHHSVGGAQYSRDLFNLVFRGNSPYAGIPLNLAQSGMTLTTYQTIGVGIFNRKKNVSGVLSFVNGQSFYDFTLSKGDFYTDTLGQYISFDYEAQVSRSDSARNAFGKSNGWGFCIDADFTFSLPLDSMFEDLKDWYVQVNQLGFIRWNQHTLNLSQDSSMYYQGFQVDNIFDPGNTFLSGETDLKDTFKLSYEQQAYTQILPATVVIGNTPDPFTGHKIKPLLGFRYRFIEYYKPMLMAGFTWRMWNKAYTAIQVHTGGFGNWRMSVRVSLPFLFKGNVVIGSNHFIGLLNSQASGRDIFAGVRIRF